MTLASLSLARGYWRVSNASVAFRLCPDANSDSSACVGGVGELCKNGTSGPLCALCLHDNHYYDDASSECRECVVSGGSASIVLPLLAVGYLLVAVAVCVGLGIGRFGTLIQNTAQHVQGVQDAEHRIATASLATVTDIRTKGAVSNDTMGLPTLHFPPFAGEKRYNYGE